jgi:hypothetical protein
VVDEVLGLRPEPPVVPKNVVRGLLEGLLRVVADDAVRQPGDRRIRFPVRREPARI